MTTFLRYFVSGNNSDLLDLNTPGVEYTLTGQRVIATGSSGVNHVRAALGVDLDARNLLGGEDVVVFSRNWAEYTKDISSVSGAIVFSYTDSARGLTEKVTVANGSIPLTRDKLIFADGAVLTQHVNTALKAVAVANVNNVALGSVTNVNLGTTTANYVLPTPAGNTLRGFASTTDGVGATFALTEAGQTFNATGTSQVDKVYVKAGSVVDARNLLGGEDIVYFTGRWADYSKSLTAISGAIQFTREVMVNGVSRNEVVTVLNGVGPLGRDKLVFADGAVLTQNVRSAVSSNPNVAVSAVSGYDASTITPFLTHDFTGEDASTVAAYLNDAANADKLATLTLAQGRQVGVDALDAVTAPKFAALSSDFIAGLADNVIASLPNALVSALSDAQVAALSNEQLAALTDAQVAAMAAAGNLDNLGAGQVATLPASTIDSVPTTVLASLTDAQVAALSAEQLGGLTDAQIGALASATPSGLSALIATQIAALGTDITGLSAAQVAALSDEQLGGLTTEQIEALDASGDLALLSAEQRGLLVNDETPPAAPLINTIATDDTVNAMEQMAVISGTNEAGATVNVSLGGNNRAATVTGTSWSYTLTADDVRAMGQGGETISATQTDAIGNTSDVVTKNITVDTQVPAVPRLALQTDSGRKGADGRTNIAAVNVSGAESDATVQVQVDGGAWTAVTGSTFDMREGTHTYAVRQIDAAGNTGEASAAVSYTLDTMSPVLDLNPGTAYFVTDITTALDRGALLQGKGAPANGSVTITFAGQAPLTIDSDAAGNWWVQLHVAIAADTTFTLALTDDVGTSSAPSSAINLPVSGNFASTLLATLNPPTLQAGQDTGASSADGISNVTTPTIRGTGAQASATITVYVNGTAEANTVTADSIGNWSYTFASALAVSTQNIAVTQSAMGFTTSALSPALAYTLDTAAPVAPAGVSLSVDSTLTLASGVTNDTTPTISGTAEAGATVQVLVNGVARGTALADALGNWNHTLGTALTDGNHQVQARQTDVAGNAGPLSTAVSLRVDTSASRLSAITISNDAGDTIAANGSTIDSTPTISGTGAEASANITVFNNGLVLGSATAAANGNWTFTPSAPLVAGQQSITAQQTDALGHVSALSTQYVFSVAAPVSLSAPTALAMATSSDTGTVGDSLTSNLRPVITGMVSDALLGMTVEVFEGTNVLGTAAVNATTGAWSFTPSTNLSTGTLSITAVLIDANGNTSPTSSSLALVLNNDVPAALSAPVLNAASDTGSSNSDGITQSRLPTFTGTGAPASASVQVLVNGSVVGLTTAAPNGNWTFTPNVAIATGAVQVTARVISASGVNGELSPALSITVDSTAPATPALSAHLAGATVNGAAPLFGTAEAGATVSLTLTPTSGSAITAQVQANAAGSWQYTPASTLANGAYTVELTATDAAGNSRAPSVTATVTVAATAVLAPTVVLGSGSDTGANTSDGITNDTTPTFNISGIDAAATAVQISTDGGSTWSAVTIANAGDTTASFTPATVLAASAAGTAYSVQVRQTVGGQTSVASTPVSVSIDNAVSVVPGNPAVALRNGGYLSTSGLSLSTGLTIEAWMKLDNVTGTKHVFTLVDDNNPANFIRFIANDSAPRYEAQLNGVLLQSNLSTTANYTTVNNNWGHVAVRLSDTGVLNLVVNGASNVNGGIANFATNMPASTTWTLRVGASNTGNGTFSGLVRDLKVWDTVRTNEEIGTAANTAATDRNTVATGTETGLVLYAPLNDAAGSTGLFNASKDTNSVSLVNGATAGVPDAGAVTNGPVHQSGPAVSFAGTAEAGSTVEISEGGVVLATVTVAASGQWSVTLQGQSAGAHTYTVTATDVASNTASVTRNVTVATPAAVPTVTPTITGLASASDTGVQGDATTNQTVFTIAGTGTLNNTRVQVLNANGDVLGVGLSDGSGNWNVTLRTLLTEGAHDLTARYASGSLTGPVSSATTITVDITATPFADGATLTLDAASDSGVLGDNITNNTSPTVSGTGAPANANVQVTFTANGQTPQTVTVQADGSGHFTATPGSALAGGAGTVWTASARAVDVAGSLSAPITTTVTVDTQGLAAPTITAPTGNVGLSPFVSGTALANTEVLVYNDTTGTLLGRTTANGAGTWTLQLLSVNTAGSVTLRAEVVDVAGNITPSSTQAVTVDAMVATPVAPAVVSGLALTGSAQANLTNDTTPTVVGQADPGVTINLYQGSTLVGTGTADNTGAFSIALTTAVTGDGLKTLTVQAVSAGVSGPSSALSYSLDTMAPSVPTALSLALASDSGVVGDRITSTTQPTFTGTGVAGSTITLLVAGAAQTTTTEVSSDGTWSLALDAPLAAGAHSITATATDAAGNTSAASAALTTTVRTGPPPAAPTVVLDSASDTGANTSDGITNDTTPTFNISGIDAAATAVQISTDGGTTWSAVTFTGSTASFTPATVLAASAAGTAYSVQVRQTVGGQTSVASTPVSVSIDNAVSVVSGNPAVALRSGGYLSTSGLSLSTGLTIEAWMKLDNVTGTKHVFTLVDDNNPANFIRFIANDSAPRYEAQLNGVLLQSNLNTTANYTTVNNNWGHVAVRLSDTGVLNLVVNGASNVNGGIANFATNMPASTTWTLRVGASNTGNGTFSGLVRDLKVWDTVRTNAEIGTAANTAATDRNTVATGTETGLVLYAPLNDAAGSTGLFNARTGTNSVSLVNGATAGVPDAGAVTNGPVHQSGPAVTLASTAEAGSTVEISEGGVVLATVTVAASGQWSVTLQGQSAGAHTYTVTATDVAGNTASVTRNVTVATPAAVNIDGLSTATDSGTAGDGITNGVAPVLQGKANAGDTITVSVNGAVLGTATADGSGNWTFALTGLADGTHRVTASNGTVTSLPFTLSKDTISPTLSSLSGLDASRAAPTFAGVTEAGASVSVVINGTTYGPVTAGSTGVFGLSLTAAQFAALAEGNHAAQLRTMDAAGNLSVRDFTWVKDTQTTVSVTAPSGTQGASFALSGSAEAGATVVVSDVTGVALGQVVAASDGSWALSLANQASGSQTLTVRATDVLGNNAQQNVSVTVDATLLAAPVLSAVADTGTLGDNTTNVVRPTLLVSGAAVGRVVQILDAADNVLGTAVVGSNGQAQVSLANPLADGTHGLRAREIDANGNTVKTSVASTVTVDTLAPAAAPVVTGLATASDSSTPGDGRTNDTTPTVQGTAAANAVVLLFVDGSSTPVRVVADGTGAWTWTPNLPLTQGVHTVQAVEQDAAGNPSGRSNLLSLTVDAVVAAPVVALRSSTDNTAAPMIEGTAEAGATLTIVNGSTPVGSVQADSNGNWRYLLSGQSNGALTLTISQTDVAGNTSLPSQIVATVNSATPSVVNGFDTLGPVVLATASDTGVSSIDGITRDATPTVQGSGAQAGATVRVFNGATQVGQAVADGSGNWSVTTSTLPNGALTLTAQQVKADGSLGLASSVAITVDTLVLTGSPSLTSSTSVNGVTYVNTALPSVQGTGNEAGATVELVNAAGTVVGSTTVLGNGTWRVTPTQALAQGEHSLSVRVTDVAGNISGLSPAVSFTVDSQIGTPAAPVLVAGFDTGTLTTDGITSLSSIRLQGQGAEPGARLTVFNGTTALGNTTVGADGKWTLSVTLPVGSHSLSARQSDAAGNVSNLSEALNLTVDNSVSALAAPQLVGADDTGTAGDVTTTNVLARVSGTGADADARIDVFANGVFRGSTQANGSGAWTFTPTGVWSIGLVNITAVQTDVAGNVSSASPALLLNVMAEPLALGAPVLASASAVAATDVVGRVTTSTTPTVQGNGATPGATVKVFNGTTELGSATADSSGQWSLVLPAQTDGASLSLRASQTVRGHVSPLSAALALTVDTAATANAELTLVASSDSGVAGDRITSDTTPTLQGVFAGQGAGVVVTIAKDGATVGQALTNANGAWSFTSATLTAGQHSFSATPAGGVASQALVLTVDNTVSTLGTPALSAASDTGSSASDGTTRLREVILTGTGAEAGATVEALSAGVVVGRAVAAADGSYAIRAQGLADGANNLTVRQSDLAGNESAASAALRVQVKTTAASLAIDGLAVGSNSGLLSDNATSDITPTLQGQGAEANANVLVWLGDVLLGQAQADASGRWSVALSALPAGTHNVVARQVDVAGNVSADSAAYALTIDTSANAPTLGLLANGDNDTGILGDGRTQNNQPIFAGVADAGATVTLWRTDQGTPISMGSAVANATGQWQVKLSTELLPANYKFAVSQVDASGNQSGLSQELPLFIQLPTDYSTQTFTTEFASANSIHITDINDDGKLDFLIGFGSGVLALYAGEEGRLFGRKISQTTGSFATVNLFDLNNDGVKDLVLGIDFARPTVSYLTSEYQLSQPSGIDISFASPRIIPIKFNGVNAAIFSSSGILVFPIVGDKLVSFNGLLAPNVMDFNNDGWLDYMFGQSNSPTFFGQPDGSFIQSTIQIPPSTPTSGAAALSAMVDVNRDGILDLIIDAGGGGSRNSSSSIGFGSAGGGAYTNTVTVLPSSYAAHFVDLDGDGWIDYFGSLANGELVFYRNEGGQINTSINKIANLAFEEIGVLTTANAARSGFRTIDLNGDRALDLLVSSDSGFISKLNASTVQEDTYLSFLVSDSAGRPVGYTVTVELYDHATNELLRVARPATARTAFTRGPTGDDLVRFYGLDPAKEYDVVVKYPGESGVVTVITGKQGLGTSGLAGGINEVVTSHLSQVRAGGKDVIHVTQENVTTASNGGRQVGTQYADLMVGDAGNDTFLPNGAPLGEAGDTIDLRNGGSDTIIFQQVANLNTATTVLGADFNATWVNGGDVIDVSGLLTALEYTGARTAADVASVLRVVANGTGLTLQANKAGVGFQDLAHVQPAAGGDISGKTLTDLVASGHLRLGGIDLTGVSSIVVDENTAQLGGVGLFNAVALTAEGGVYARGFDGGSLRVTLDNAYAEDRWAVTAGNGITVSGSSISVNGTAVATVDSSANGQGTDLLLTFSFSGSSLSAADQAAVVQQVVQAIDYANTGSTPPDYARSVKLTVSDGAASAESTTLLNVTPTADTEVLGGVRHMTGTDGVNTLTGSTSDETFVGYGGPVGSSGEVNGTGDTLTGGGGADTFVYRAGNVGRDTITDFTLGIFGANANADRINLSDVLQGYVDGTSNLNDFVRLFENVDGSGTVTGTSVRVDFNGTADASTFQHYLEVRLNGVTLGGAAVPDLEALRSQLITNGQVVI